MGSILIRGGQVMDPGSGLDEVRDVLIDGEFILAIGRDLSRLAPPDTEIIDASGKVVAPGFLDPHVHFREPGTEGETILSGSSAAVAGGYTTVCVMPNTNPAIDNNESVAWQQERAKEANKARVLVMGALTDRREGKKPSDMAGMARAGIAGVSDDGSGVQDPAVMLECMKLAADLGLVVSDHAEDSCLSGCGLIHDGEVSKALKLPGKPSISEWLMVARDINLATEAGCALHIAHASTYQTLEIVERAKQAGLPVTVEVTPHHLVFTDERVARLDTNAKMNPPLRSHDDLNALIDGVRSGLIDAIATDHAPHPAAKKALGIKDAPNGVIGLETTFPVLNGVLVKKHGIPLMRLIELLTSGPARCFGMGHFGSLEAGFPADIVILDVDEPWHIDATKFSSASRNTPFDDYGVTGRVLTTIVAGRVVYQYQKEAQ